MRVSRLWLAEMVSEPAALGIRQACGALKVSRLDDAGLLVCGWLNGRLAALGVLQACGGHIVRLFTGGRQSRALSVGRHACVNPMWRAVQLKGLMLFTSLFGSAVLVLLQFVYFAHYMIIRLAEDGRTALGSVEGASGVC